MTGPLLRISLVKVKQSVCKFYFRSETLLNTIDLMIVIVWEGFQQISSILAVWGDSSFKAHLIKPAFAKLMPQNIQIFTRQQAHQSIVTSMKIILTSSLLTFQVLCTKFKPAVAWFHWQITLVAILHVPLTSRENASREKPWPGFIVLHCWLKNATHTLPLFPCRVILYNYALNADGHSKRVDGFSLFLKKKGTISSCRISVYAQPRYGYRTLLPWLLYGIMYTKYIDGRMLIDT